MSPGKLTDGRRAHNSEFKIKVGTSLERVNSALGPVEATLDIPLDLGPNSWTTQTTKTSSSPWAMTFVRRLILLAIFIYSSWESWSCPFSGQGSQGQIEAPGNVGLISEPFSQWVRHIESAFINLSPLPICLPCMISSKPIWLVLPVFDDWQATYYSCLPLPGTSGGFY